MKQALYGMASAIALVIGILLSLPVLANVTAASGVAQPATISPSNSSTTVRWQLSVDRDVSGGPQRVTSSAGQILASNGAVLQTVNTTLSQTGAGTLAFTEPLALPPASVRNWIGQGYRQVIYQRTFSPTQGRAQAARVTLLLQGNSAPAAPISPTTPPSPGSPASPDNSFPRSPLLSSRTPSAELVVRGLELRFRSSLASIEVVEQQAWLQAELRISHSGTGMLEGEWQLAEPGSTAGKPIYRPLIRVRQVLSGQQLSVLFSPQLPTRASGKYILRFCALDGIATAENIGTQPCTTERLTAVTAYQVLAGETVAIQPIRVLAPKTEAVDDRTLFQWTPVKNAVVYQMQIFARGPDRSTTDFITGILLPRSQQETRLSSVMTQHLINGKRYLWRLNALDEQGRSVGRSPEGSFTYVPPTPRSVEPRE